MANTLDESELEDEQLQRPTFLTVLCILTFVGSGLGILGSIYNIFAIEQSIEQMRMVSNMMPGFDEMADAIERYGMLSYMLNAVASLGGLYAAWAMWKLQKIGFYVYVPCEIVPSVFSIFFLTGFGNGMFAMMAIVGLVIPVAFVIMYYVNLKYMR